MTLTGSVEILIPSDVDFKKLVSKIGFRVRTDTEISNYLCSRKAWDGRMKLMKSEALFVIYRDRDLFVRENVTGQSGLSFH